MLDSPGRPAALIVSQLGLQRSGINVRVLRASIDSDVPSGIASFARARLDEDQGTLLHREIIM
jgi:hypothetical protein